MMNKSVWEDRIVYLEDLDEAVVTSLVLDVDEVRNAIRGVDLPTAQLRLPGLSAEDYAAVNAFVAMGAADELLAIRQRKAEFARRWF